MKEFGFLTVPIVPFFLNPPVLKSAVQKSSLPFKTYLGWFWTFHILKEVSPDMCLFVGVPSSRFWPRGLDTF